MPLHLRERKSRRLRTSILAILAATGMIVTMAPASWAQPAFTADDVSLTIEGNQVSARTHITTSRTVTASLVGICARDKHDWDVDFPLSKNVRLSTTPTSVSSTATFAPGKYQLWPCAKVQNVWYDLAQPSSFTVTGSTPSTAAKSGTATKNTTDKATAKKTTTKKAAAPKSPAKKSSTAANSAKKKPAQKAPAKKATVKKTPATKNTTPKQPQPSVAAPAPGGTAMPVGDLPGWKQIFADDFTKPLQKGSFPAHYQSQWASYHGFKDTFKIAHYDQRVISVKNGILDIHLHTNNGQPLSATPVPLVDGKWGGQLYGRYSVRMRADAVPNFKVAFLLWPDSENWNDGEINFPEGSLTDRPMAFNHCVGHPQDNCYAAQSSVKFTDWHTYTIEWTPKKISYFIDGKLLGSTTKSIPNKPMHWVLQVESDGTRPHPHATGHVEIDWATIYRYTP